jgi:hypothetical protein
MIKQYTRLYYRAGQEEPVAVYTGDLPLPDGYEPVEHSDEVLEKLDVVMDVDVPDMNFHTGQQILRPKEIRQKCLVRNGRMMRAPGQSIAALVRHNEEPIHESDIRQKVLNALATYATPEEVDSVRDSKISDLIRLMKRIENPQQE